MNDKEEKEEIEFLRVRLECFIRYYIPKGWKETIGKVDFVPLFTDSELEVVRRGEVPTEREYRRYINEAIREFIEIEKSNL